MLVVAGVAASVLTASASAQTTPSEDAVEVGGRIYAEQCATCHGFSGQGGDIPGSDQLAPPLVGEGAEGVTLAFADLVMRVGRMPPPKSNPFDNRARTVLLSDLEREAVNAFLQSELGVPGDIPEVPPGDPSQGQQLFATNCAACHGSTGAGGVAGAGAWTPAVTTLEPVTIAEAVRVGPFEMPAFSSDQISDPEIGHIAAFLEAVEDETRTPLGLLELNPVYASGLAAVFVLAVLVVVRIVAGRPSAMPDPEGQHQDSGGSPRARS